MPFNPSDPVQDDGPLLALLSLKARHSYMFNGRNIGHDFYRGWLSDFIAACDDVHRVLGDNKRGFHFRQIKEKYGWARYYWETYHLSPIRMSLVAGGSVVERQFGVENADESYASGKPTLNG